MTDVPSESPPDLAEAEALAALLYGRVEAVAVQKHGPRFCPEGRPWCAYVRHTVANWAARSPTHATFHAEREGAVEGVTEALRGAVFCRVAEVDTEALRTHLRGVVLANAALDMLAQALRVGGLAPAAARSATDEPTPSPA